MSKGSGIKIPDPQENYPEYLMFTALRADIPFTEIENMTATEIALAVHAKHEQNKEKAQMQAWIAHSTAALIGLAVNEPKKFPNLEAAFPSLFEKKIQQKQDWRIMKARMEAYAKAKNENQY